MKLSYLLVVERERSIDDIATGGWLSMLYTRRYGLYRIIALHVATNTRIILPIIY